MPRVARPSLAAAIALAVGGLMLSWQRGVLGGAGRRGRFLVRGWLLSIGARVRWPINVAGQSRGMAGFGGSGLVNFDLLASGAVAYAPPELDRDAIVDAIGRGVGRSAAHEFAHQLLPRAPIHATRDRASYEFYSAGRAEHYFGDLRWDLAGPLLRARLAAP